MPASSSTKRIAIIGGGFSGVMTAVNVARMSKHPRQLILINGPGQLQVHSATIERVEAEGEKVKVCLEGGQSLSGDLVINATGPQTRFSASKSVLPGKLMEKGLIAPDEMDMGIRIAEDHTAVMKDGSESEVLLALGPLLRGTLWETIAVPELRGQASRVAATLVGGPVAPAEDLSALVEFII